ncbi:MAG: hypothetical protein WD904_09150 [Dehalococcoidia bacterium]
MAMTKDVIANWGIAQGPRRPLGDLLFFDPLKMADQIEIDTSKDGPNG